MRIISAGIITIAALLTAALSLPAHAAITPDELAAKLQTSYDKTRDLKADFVQTTEFKAMHISRQSKGTLTIKKPGLLRYTYVEPDRQETVIKDGALVMYLPDAKQAVKRSLDRDTMDRTPLTFLAGLGKITDSFRTGFPDGAFKDADGNYLLELKPKGRGMGVEKITLTIEPAAYGITGFSFVETSGNTNTFSLTNIKLNGNVKDAVFELKLPGDVKVISQ